MPWQIWERSKMNSSYPPGNRAPFQPHQTRQPFTFRKRTAMNAMVKVTITLAYSSVGNFSRVGKKPCEKRGRVPVIHTCSFYRSHTKWWRSQGFSQQGGTGHLPFLIRKSTGIFSPQTVCTPLAKIFRRLFKWELKVWLFNKDEKLMHFQCMQAGSIQIILLCNLHP